MCRDIGTIRRRFCPLHSLDGWRAATVIKRMAIRSPMAWREAPRHRPTSPDGRLKMKDLKNAVDEKPKIAFI